jgi:hypothetical protein
MNLRSLNESIILLSAGITTLDFAFLPTKHHLSLSLYIVPAALIFIFALSLLTSKRDYRIAAFKIMLTYSLFSAMFVGLLVPIGQALAFLFESDFNFQGWLNIYSKWAIIQFVSGLTFGVIGLCSFIGLKRNIGT